MAGIFAVGLSKDRGIWFYSMICHLTLVQQSTRRERQDLGVRLSMREDQIEGTHNLQTGGSRVISRKTIRRAKRNTEKGEGVDSIVW